MYTTLELINKIDAAIDKALQAQEFKQGDQEVVQARIDFLFTQRERLEAKLSAEQRATLQGSAMKMRRGIS